MQFSDWLMRSEVLRATMTTIHKATNKARPQCSIQCHVWEDWELNSVLGLVVSGKKQNGGRKSAKLILSSSAIKSNGFLAQWQQEYKSRTCQRQLS